jgi:hypothetical protein
MDIVHQNDAAVTAALGDAKAEEGREFAFSRRMARFTIALGVLPRHQSSVSTSAARVDATVDLALDPLP